jgi:valyl-tRNA synthetase
LAISRVSGYRTFLNKIWNATRFVLMRVGDAPILPLSEVKKDLAPEDRWILSRMNRVVEKVRSDLDSYAFSSASETIYQFFWTEFCDWYVEFAKLKLDEKAGAQSREATRTVLVDLLDTSMRLLHPFCPFLSEEIWQKLPSRESKWKELGVSFCAVAPFPQVEKRLIDDEAEREIALLKDAVVMIRNARQESNLPAQKKMEAILLVDNESTQNMLQKYESQIERLALVSKLSIKPRANAVVPKLAAINSSARVDAILPLEGLIDIDAEKARLKKELQKVVQELAGIQGRLSNAGFVAKAPPEVVEECKRNAENLTEKKARIEQAVLRLEK